MIFALFIGSIRTLFIIYSAIYEKGWKNNRIFYRHRFVITIAVSIVAIYHMGYNTAHYKEKDIEAINQATFENRYNEQSEYKDIIISKEEAIKNYYSKDSVFDIDREDYETAKWVLESSFPKEIIRDGGGYECVESGNTSSVDRIIRMFLLTGISNNTLVSGRMGESLFRYISQ